MHRIGYLMTEGFQIMALATQTVFECANTVVGDSFYALENVSVHAGDVHSSTGMAMRTTPLSQCRNMDTWMVVGVFNPITNPPPREIVDFLRDGSGGARRIAAICTGGFVVAEAGLLSNRRATTHWLYAKELQKRFPDITVEEDRIYIVDGPVWTSAGMTAGLDLALALVEKDLGENVARSVAHKLVMHQRRAGGQSQHSEMLDLSPKSDRIQDALNYARKNLKRPLPVEELAQAAHLSPRQFSRVFTMETGSSPAKAIEGLRVEAARLMVEQSRHSLDTIATETGFRDARHMREAFMRGFGIPPQAIRRRGRPEIPVSRPRR